jgi:hypothetical protein
MSFSVDLSRFAKKTNSSLNEACRAIKISLFNSIIQDTRVRTGRLKGNWQTSTGSPITSETERLDPSESKATAEVQNKVTGTGTVDYFTNNLPYAGVWEEKDGMMSKNLARISRIIRESVK